MNLVRFGQLALGLCLVFATPACSEMVGDDAESSDADFTRLRASEIDVHNSISFGDRRRGLIGANDKPIWTVSFQGTKGDQVKATVWSTINGNAFLFKKTAPNQYALIQQKGVSGSHNTILQTTLTTSGEFFIGFDAFFGAHDTSVRSVSITLGGTPANSDTAWVKALKEAYEENGDDGSSIADSALPVAAKRQFAQWKREYAPDYTPDARLWTFQGKKVYVVEEDTDGGMYIAFFNENGDEVASGSAGESSDFSWD